MRDDLILKDFNQWKESSKGKEFSLYDYVFILFNMKEMNTDIYFALLEIFWPTFISYKDYFFLKEGFSERRFDELVKQKENVEFWINFLTVDPYFENDEDGEERAQFFTRSLVKMWQAKLKIDFPLMNFTVQYLYDEEFGDYGLTFYQTKN